MWFDAGFVHVFAGRYTHWSSINVSCSLRGPIVFPSHGYRDEDLIYLESDRQQFKKLKQWRTEQI